MRAERFQRIGSSNVPALCGLRAAIKLANDIGTRPHRAPPPPARRLSPGRNEKARRRVLDLARSRTALRHHHRKRPAGPTHGPRELAVEHPQDPHPRRQTRTSSASPPRTTFRNQTSTASSKNSTNTNKKNTPGNREKIAHRFTFACTTSSNAQHVRAHNTFESVTHSNYSLTRITHSFESLVRSNAFCFT